MSKFAPIKLVIIIIISSIANFGDDSAQLCSGGDTRT